MLSYWPHQALTSITAGCSRMAMAADDAPGRPIAKRVEHEQREPDVGQRGRAAS